MQLPPHDRESEMTVLCGLMREFELVYRELQVVGLSEGDFYFHTHQLAYRRLLELYDVGEPGPYTLFRRIERAGQCEEWGGRQSLLWWITEALDADPSGYDAMACGVRVHWLACRRRAIHRANEVIRDAYDGVWGPDHYEELASVT